MKEIKRNPIQISVEPLEKHHHWRVTEDFHYYSERYKTHIDIPEGFIFDGCSIPKVFRLIIPVTGKKLGPGCVHDYIYRYGGVNKVLGDLIFKEALQINGVKKMTVRIMYNAVDVFGHSAWKNNREND